MKLIVNADDFGLTDGVTFGILSAIERGIVTSTTMMVNMPGAQTAAEIARKAPALAVGLHINISLGSPLTRCESLTENGKFQKPSVIGTDERYKEEDLYPEMRAQYNRFLELTGRRPTHLDSHLYVHQKFPKVRRAIRMLAEEEKLPVRDMETRQFPRVYFEGNFKVKPGETTADLKQKYVGLLADLAARPIAELMVHPAFLDEWLLHNSSYNSQRIAEHTVLTDPETRRILTQKAIRLATYRDLE